MERDIKKSSINNHVPIWEVSDQKDHKAFHKHSWFIYFLLKQEKKKSSQDEKPKQRIQYNKNPLRPQRCTHSPATEKTEAA